MRLKSVAPLLLLAICLSAGRALAVDQDIPVPATPLVLPGQGTDNDQRMVVVRQLMRQSAFEPAAALLESIYETDTTNSVVINLLKVCYRQIKQYAKFELLARKMIARSPNDFLNRLDLAEALVEEGQADSAKVYYRQAVSLITDRDKTKYMIIIRSEMSHGLENEAGTLIDSLRLSYGDPKLFAVDRAEGYEAERQYDKAVAEYLPVLATDTTGAGLEAERRLMMLLEFEQSSTLVEKLLLDATKNDQNPKVVKLLADYYIRAGRFDRAFEYSVRRDSLEKGDGGPLVYYLNQCYERKLYPQVVQMGQFLLLHHRNSPLIIGSMLLYADALVHAGRIPEARTQLDTVFMTSPLEQDKGEALYRQGMICYDNLHNYKQAMSYFDSVTAHYRRGPSYINAQRMAPYCHLRAGDLDAAASGFATVSRQLADPDIAEEASFNLGLIRFYSHQFDSAAASFKKLMVEYPRGMYVNEAVRLILALNEAKGDSTILSDYANALWSIERDKLDSARTVLNALATANRALADVALFRLIQLDLQVNDSAAATAGVDRMSNEHPDSYYIPYALRIKADMLAASPATIGAARDIYMEILQKYPDFPFVTEVRKKLRQIETDSKIG